MGLSKRAWKYVNIIHEIRELVCSINVSLAYIPRDQNSLVDKIAKWAVGLNEFFIYDVMFDTLARGS